MNTYAIALLPLSFEVETNQVLKKAIQANKKIAELKGIAQTIPSQSLLLNTLAIQESKDSSEIESIVTTHDELFSFSKESTEKFSPAAKEVFSYNEALFYGFNALKDGAITNNLLIEISQLVTKRNTGFRNTMGTHLKDIHDNIIYSPPQIESDIWKLMTNLEEFINNSELSNLDPLVKMAIIHHQFESIHPFFDGNGRTGRILNILYLIQEGVLDIPVLYVSRYLIKNKATYYKLLQQVRDENSGEAWEEWVLFILDALESTATQAIDMIESIKELLSAFKGRIRNETKFYSHELINNLFSHPYTTVDFMMKDLKVSRLTTSKYLNILVDIDLLKKEKVGKTNYYINTKLVSLFSELH